MHHSEGRSGGGFPNNSSCLGVSRKLSTTGNHMLNRGIAAAWDWQMLLGGGVRAFLTGGMGWIKTLRPPRPRVRKRSRLIFLHHPDEQRGNHDQMLQVGNAAVVGSRDFPSFLRAKTALVSLHCAVNQAAGDLRACRLSVCLPYHSTVREKLATSKKTNDSSGRPYRIRIRSPR